MTVVHPARVRDISFFCIKDNEVERNRSISQARVSPQIAMKFKLSLFVFLALITVGIGASPTPEAKLSELQG
jgi:hypothetical protein